jgi:hypothetical protein
LATVCLRNTKFDILTSPTNLVSTLLYQSKIKKIHLQVLKIIKIQLNHILILKNQRKSSTNTLWAEVSLPNMKFDIFTSPTNLVYVKIHWQALKIIKIQYNHFCIQTKIRERVQQTHFGQQ